jgi:high affinity Mn2+ porin
MTKTLKTVRTGWAKTSFAASLVLLMAGFCVPGAQADDEIVAIHGQATSLSQYHPAFRSTYRGANSLDPGNRGQTTNDLTLYLGVRPWAGGEVWVNEEIDQGFGLSNTLGVAGFPSGEAYKVGRAEPYFRMQRWFLRQTFDLGGEKADQGADLNSLAASHTANRLVVTLGKFSVGDVFDANTYAHDPRADFMNWSLIDTGTFDYAADAWGYTYGAAFDLKLADWSGRAGVFTLSDVPNSPRLDHRPSQFQLIGEVERRYQWGERSGAVRITTFLSRGRMGRFADAVRLAQEDGGPADIAAVRRYASRAGVSLNMEQALTATLGGFIRAGWAEGDRESYEFTDIDRTLAAGLSLSGASFGRKDDTTGAALVVNQASAARQHYLAAGGIGILVGDGRLPHPGDEAIAEVYYKTPLLPGLQTTFDYQLVNNPGYNRDRGPVSVLGLRLHVQH